MSNKQEALGILETQGLKAILEVTDARLKAANGTLIGKEKIGGLRHRHRARRRGGSYSGD